MGRMGRVGGRTRSSSRMAIEGGKLKCEKNRVVWHLRLDPYHIPHAVKARVDLTIGQPVIR